nr:helicase-related protein [Alicyclobacillus mali (ex Roth et al. 2021)]
MVREMQENAKRGFQSRLWQHRYRTSAVIDGRPMDILHDFYLPALELATRYDRVAGYFRSSSLAAASRGFSSMVGRKGTIRMVVGADLDPEDVRAVLRGDQARLARALGRELEDSSLWPAPVQDGVTLLAWMVAQGVLEIRVALRRHAETGEPLPFDSTEDGYFHDKFFILTDDEDCRIYGTGSLNESRTALVLNAESIDIHCDWWSDIDRIRCDEAQADFERLWDGKAPHFAVCPLPDAVRRRLIRLAEGVTVVREVDGTEVEVAPEQASSPSAPSALEWLRFAVIRDAPRMPGGEQVGIETAPVAPWPHQRVVAERLVEDWPYNYMLCDEVGLGKTIEAGLAFRALYLSGWIRRILVAAPASLTEQWLQQMKTKMLLPFARLRMSPSPEHRYLLPYEHSVPARMPYGADLLIVSTGLWQREGAARDLLAAPPYDLVLVDEAHMARRHNASAGMDEAPDYSNLYRLLDSSVRPHSRSLWLATATPLQLDMVEVADLVRLVGRVSGFQYEPALFRTYYESLAKLLHEERLSDWEWRFVRDALQALKSHDPALWHFITEHVLTRMQTRALDAWFEQPEAGEPSRRARDKMPIVARMAAPLSRVMLRHTRELLKVYKQHGQLNGSLAEREVRPVEALEYTPEEAHVYKLLNRYCEGLRDRLGSDSSRGASARFSVRFLESLLRLRFASSLYAFAKTVERRLKRVIATLEHAEREETPLATDLETEDVYEPEVEDTEVFEVELLAHRDPEVLRWERRQLEQLKQVLQAITTTPTKTRKLLDVLDQRRLGDGRLKQTVIFTRFYDTLVHLREKLFERMPGVRLGAYSGREAGYFDVELQMWIETDREEVKERFLAGEIDLLLCTDAAAEGLNLQTADMLINFDLGWNPMKIEQRIGRIDRIGQRHNRIYVLNLCYAQSEEGEVYARLLKRLAEAKHVVGPQQLSLLPVRTEEFEQLAKGELALDELHQRVMSRLEAEERQAHLMQLSADEMYEMYERMLATSSGRTTPLRLQDIWDTLAGSAYLKGLGCYTEETPYGPVFVVQGVPGVEDGTRLTVSPELYERGLPGHHIHFASYGDPAFDTIVEHVLSHPMPSGVRRVSVPGGEYGPIERCGYVVLCDSQEGHEARFTVHHVTSFQDTLHVRDVATDVDWNVVAPAAENVLRERLADELSRAIRVRQEKRNAQSVNEKLGFYHAWLSVVTADRLLREVRGSKDEAQIRATAAIREYEERFCDRHAIRIPLVPVRILASWFPHAMAVDRENAWIEGDLTQLVVGFPYIQAGLSVARRAVDALKKEEGSVTLQKLQHRLVIEEESWMRKLASG